MLVVKSALTRGVPAIINFILNFVLNLLESVQNKAQKVELTDYWLLISDHAGIPSSANCILSPNSSTYCSTEIFRHVSPSITVYER